VREIEGLINGLLKWLVRLSVPAFVFFVFASQRLSGTILGKSWESVGSYVAILAGPAWLMLQTAWLDRMMDRMGRQKLALGIEAVYTTVALIGLGAALHITHDPLISIVVFAVVTVIYQTVWVVAMYRCAGYATSALARFALEATGLAISAIAVLWLVAGFLPPVLAAATGAIAICAYTFLMFKVARADAGLSHIL
jgi:O-antigen/teichoic acid export membrane protein